MDKYRHYRKILEKKKEQQGSARFDCAAHLGKRKQARCINFTSNDFLGLSDHPYIKKTAIKYVLEWGVGTAASPSVSKHLEDHRGVEEKLAELVGKEKALLFPSAYQVHSQILSTLLNAKTDVFIDRYCHQGLIQAALKSGAQVFRYERSHLTQLSSLLEKTRSENVKWIITESLSSVDGEVIDLKKLGEIADFYGALTYVDDSNCVGVLGKHGMGLGAHRKGIDLLFGSFGKTGETFGAYLATTQIMRDYLLVFNPGLIENTTLPPALLGAISGLLDLIPDMHAERQKIKDTSHLLRTSLTENHWEIGIGSSHIIPLFCINEKECEKIAQTLLNQSILATPLQPPLVPQGASGIRFHITSLHSQEDISTLLNVLKSLSEERSFSTV